MWKWVVRIASVLGSRSYWSSGAWDEEWKAQVNLEAHVNQTPPDIPMEKGEYITDFGVKKV